MRKLNRFKSIKSMLTVLSMPLLLVFSSSAVMADVLAEAKAEIMTENYLNKTQKLADNIWVGPQLSELELNKLDADKFTQVINFRTEEEMQALSYDESDLLNKKSVAYHLIPMGDAATYSPVQLTEFNQLMTAHGDENILMHCRSGYRANLMYGAWLIKYQGMSKEEAKTQVHAWSDEAVNNLIGADTTEVDTAK